MKTAFIAIFLSLLLFACEKDCDELRGSGILLKAIYYPKDSAMIPENPDIVIGQKVETFYYDEQGRVISRFIYGINTVEDSTWNDTSEIYTYSYLNSSPVIQSYTHEDIDGRFEHLVFYDAQGRIIKDSVTNPQIMDNKVTTFMYKPDTIIQYEKQVFVVGTQTIIDTILFTGGKISKEKLIFTSGSNAPIYWEIDYAPTIYLNPLSYLNTFSLLASDRKNGSNSALFSLINPEFISEYLPTVVIFKYSSSTTNTNYTTSFTHIVDAMGRIISVTDNYGDETVYEYY